MATVKTATRGPAQHTLHIRWKKRGGASDAEQTARDIAETVLGELQRRLDAPRLAAPGPVLRAIRDDRSIAQSATPLSYFIDNERVVGW